MGDDVVGVGRTDTSTPSLPALATTSFPLTGTANIRVPFAVAMARSSADSSAETVESSTPKTPKPLIFSKIDGLLIIVY